jgi:Zn-dependent protease
MMDLDLVEGLKWYIVFLFSTAWHEAAHSWAAWKLGDDTAYQGGQVSLDPTSHIQREPIGMVVVPLLSYYFGGWMIGWASAPYRPSWSAEYPRRAAAMALAGPAANLAIMLIAVLLIRVGLEWNVFKLSNQPAFADVVRAARTEGGLWSFWAKTLSLCFSLNLLLALFNLLPLPPLDGSHIPYFLLSKSAGEKYRAISKQPACAMIGLVGAWHLCGLFFHPMFAGALNVLYTIVPRR